MQRKRGRRSWNAGKAQRTHNLNVAAHIGALRLGRLADLRERGEERLAVEGEVLGGHAGALWGGGGSKGRSSERGSGKSALAGAQLHLRCQGMESGSVGGRGRTARTIRGAVKLAAWNS